METTVKFKFKISEAEGKRLYKEQYLKLHNDLLNIGLKEKEFGHYEGDISPAKQFNVLSAIYYDVFLMSRFEFLTVNLEGYDENIKEYFLKILNDEKDSFKKNAPHILGYFDLD